MTNIPHVSRVASPLHVLKFAPPEWLGYALHVVILSREPWLEGAAVLHLLGKSDDSRGATYERMPPEHRRKLARRRVGLAGPGQPKAVFISLPGLRRLLRLQRAAERRAGEGRAADALESALTTLILPTIEAAVGVSDLWAQSVEAPPPAQEMTEAEVRARLREVEDEQMTVSGYVRARRLSAGKAQSDELGRWAAGRCRALGLPITEPGTGKGPGAYPRRVLDEGVRWLNLASLPAARTWNP